ncbi:toll/interleukin-1 receptor domain-containing protein [Microbacterium sp. DT81.1]|uniref:toll/interleukin-1 receptor domain-containing protein n=1 Tax=Microbacterium sp. DT81.1 TaxID=3393413 RepID=UPI003CEA5D03
MRVFVSYSRKDVTALESLTRGLKALGHEVWLDQELSGGLEWWVAILERIRDAEAFVAVVSRSSLASVACSREREYAVALAKPILPVAIEPTPIHLLPPDLAQRQLVDYITPNDDAAFALLRGIARLPAAPPLPVPPPLPPPVPMTYLSEISHQIYANTLSREQQLSIVGRLRDAMTNAEYYDPARELVTLFEGRDDLYAVTERQLREIMALPRPSLTEPDHGGDASGDPSGEDQRPYTVPRRRTGSNVGLIITVVMAIVAILIGGLNSALSWLLWVGFLLAGIFLIVAVFRGMAALFRLTSGSDSPGGTAASVGDEPPRTSSRRRSQGSIKSLALIMIIIGVILAFMVNIEVGWVNLALVGYILMAAGAVVFVIALLKA